MSTLADQEAEKSWENAEGAIGSQVEIESKAEEKEELAKPKRNLLHKFGFLASVLATFAAFCMGLSQIVGIIFTNVGVIQIILRLYVILFCAVIIMVEMEWTKFAKESYILHNWWTRGLIYGFVGVIGLEEIDTQEFKEIELSVNPAEIYVKVIAWVMVGVGVFYFLLGILCVQGRYENQRTDFAERKARSVLVAGQDPASIQP